MVRQSKGSSAYHVDGPSGSDSPQRHRQSRSHEHQSGTGSDHGSRRRQHRASGARHVLEGSTAEATSQAWPDIMTFPLRPSAPQSIAESLHMATVPELPTDNSMPTDAQIDEPSDDMPIDDESVEHVSPLDSYQWIRDLCTDIKRHGQMFDWASEIVEDSRSSRNDLRTRTFEDVGLEAYKALTAAREALEQFLSVKIWKGEKRPETFEGAEMLVQDLAMLQPPSDEGKFLLRLRQAGESKGAEGTAGEVESLKEDLRKVYPDFAELEQAAVKEHLEDTESWVETNIEQIEWELARARARLAVAESPEAQRSVEKQLVPICAQPWGMDWDPDASFRKAEAKLMDVESNISGESSFQLEDKMQDAIKAMLAHRAGYGAGLDIEGMQAVFDHSVELGISSTQSNSDGRPSDEGAPPTSRSQEDRADQSSGRVSKRKSARVVREGEEHSERRHGSRSSKGKGSRR